VALLVAWLAFPLLLAGLSFGCGRLLEAASGARLPRARALIVPATGHAVHLEAPAIVAAALAGQDA